MNNIIKSTRLLKVGLTTSRYAVCGRHRRWWSRGFHVEKLFSALFKLFHCTGPDHPASFPQEALRTVAKFAMAASVRGKFDRLGIDYRGNRLFVAAERIGATEGLRRHSLQRAMRRPAFRSPWR